jgi:hypothetical protein
MPGGDVSEGTASIIESIKYCRCPVKSPGRLTATKPVETVRSDYQLQRENAV